MSALTESPSALAVTLQNILNADYDWQDTLIDEDDYDALFIAAMLDFLQKNSPEARQKLALSWNFDNAPEILDWVISQPDTDKGTILYLYWYLQPGFQKKFLDRKACEQESSWYLPTFDLLDKIEHQFCNGFYQDQKYDFSPQYDIYQDGYNWTSELEPETFKRTIPGQMLIPITGEILESPEWDEGVPHELMPVMDRLYDLLED